MLDQVKKDLVEALKEHKYWFARDPFKKKLELYTFSFYDEVAGMVYFTPKKSFLFSSKVFTVKQLTQAASQRLFYPARIRGGRDAAL